MSNLEFIKYGVKIHTLEYIERNFYIDYNGFVYRKYGDKVASHTKAFGEIIILDLYHTTTKLGIPDWIIEEKFNSRDNPEYFI